MSPAAGFEFEDAATHTRALTWYGGSLNLTSGQFGAEPKDQLPEGETVYRRLGDLDADGYDPNQHWYFPDHAASQNGNSADDAPWEGIGTGWFHSTLGGGTLGLRPVGLHTPRTNVSSDNLTTGNPAIDKMRGDFTVPTLFNGNFDAIAVKMDNQTIPGWSDTLQDQLVNINTVTSLNNHLSKLGSDRSIPNFAVELTSGESITHNRFVVPDWGVLRFDLFVPELTGGTVTVTLRGVDGEVESETIYLAEANGPYDLGYNDQDTYRIGYGNTGFETFHIELI